MRSDFWLRKRIAHVMLDQFCERANIAHDVQGKNLQSNFIAPDLASVPTLDMKIRMDVRSGNWLPHPAKWVPTKLPSD